MKARGLALMGCVAAAAVAALAVHRVLPAALVVSLVGGQFELGAARWLSALALLPLVPVTALFATRGDIPVQLALAAILRVVVLAAGVLALTQPRQLLPARTATTALLVDVSDSVDAAVLTHTRDQIRAFCRAAGRDPIGLVTFAHRPRTHGDPCRQEVPLARHDAGDQTDIEAALDMAIAASDARQTARIVLFSDGVETLGKAERAAERAGHAGIPIFFEAPQHVDTAELAVLSLALPSTVKAGDPFTVQARVSASHAGQARLILSRDGKPEPTQLAGPVGLQAGDNMFSWRSQAAKPGSTTYRVTLQPEGPDRLASNNQLERTVRVLGEPRVLYVERERSHTLPLRSLLEAAGFEVTVRGPEGAPNTPLELQDVDFYILSDVPHAALPEGAAGAIASYVNAGGAFLMAGGEQSLSLGGYRGTALGRLLPVSLERKEQHEEPTLALTLVIDKSGSMSDEKIALAKEAARATAALLHEDDYLGVIGFDAAPTHVVRLSAARNRSAIERGIDRLKAGGGTAIFPALDAAYADLSGVRARKKHVILLTDGQTREAGLDVLVQNMQLSDITLSTVGLGQDVSRKLLEDLARIGHGRSYFTDDPRHVPRLFLHDTEAVSRSSAVEQPIGVHMVSPAAFLKGVNLSAAPPLSGFVSTTARAAPAQQVLQTSTGEPLLSRMRVGLGWSLAFTSDLKPRWNSWFGWSDFSRLLAQLVREHMRQTASDDLLIRTRSEAGQLWADVEVLDEQRRFVNDLSGELTLARDPGETVLERVPMQLVAPGLYRAVLRPPANGSYRLSAALSHPGAAPVRAFGSLGQVLPAEYGRLPPDLDLLERLARTSGGRALDDPGSALGAGVRPSVREPRWAGLLWLSLLAFCAELTLRRLGRRRTRPPPG